MDIMHGAGDLGAQPVVVDGVKDVIRFEIGDALLIIPTCSPEYDGGPRRVTLSVDDFTTILAIAINGQVR